MSRTPFLPQTEDIVLGSCMLRPDLIDQLVAEIGTDGFFLDSNKRVFSVLSRLRAHNRCVDITMVIDTLKNANQLEQAGGAARIAALLDGVWRVDNLDSYIKELRDAATKRRLLHALAKIDALVQEGELTGEELVQQAESMIFDVQQSPKGGFVLLADVVRKRLNEIEHMQGNVDTSAILSGFPDLDAYIGGWRKGQMIVIGARPGAGKTAFGLAVGLNAAAQGFKVGKFSLEMSADEIADRSLSSITRINSRELRSGFLQPHHWEALIETQNHLESCPFYIDETPDLTIGEMKAKARRLKVEHGLDLIILDYLQLLEGDKNNESRYQQISKISRDIKKMAKELNVPVIALSQLSREVEKRPNHTPQLADIRESGCIEQDSDLVLLLYRPELYRDCPEEQKGITEVIIAKQRNGATHTVKLGFQPEFTRFNSLYQ